MVKYLNEFQVRCNRLYRTCFVDETKRNEDFLTDKGFTVDFARSLIMNVSTDIKMIEETNKLIEKDISELKKEFDKTQNDLKESYKLKPSKYLTKDIKKLKRKRDKVFGKICRLEASLKRNVVFGGRKKLQDRTKDLITHEEFHELRSKPVWFRGDADRHGNRSFDLTRMNEGLVTLINPDLNCSPEVKRLSFKIKVSSKNRQKILNSLQVLINNKEIPITCSITPELFYVAYDETKLNGTFFDKKKFTKEVKTINNSKPSDDFLNNFDGEDVKHNDIVDFKTFLHEKYKEHDKKLKEGKFERYLAVDLNPYEFGYVIAYIDGTVIESGCLHYGNKSGSANKRNYEYGQMVKYLMRKIKHYKVSYFIKEDLDSLKRKGDHGNKVSNRKINNEFNLNFIQGVIERRCKESKTILIEVNPEYSSFIGNIIHFTDYDPIAAAKEIVRRGITKYTKGSTIYPTIDKDIAAHWGIDVQDDTESFKKWMSLYKSLKNTKYRNKEFEVKSKLFSFKSDVKLYVSKRVGNLVGSTVTDRLIKLN